MGVFAITGELLNFGFFQIRFIKYQSDLLSVNRIKIQGCIKIKLGFKCICVIIFVIYFILILSLIPCKGLQWDLLVFPIISIRTSILYKGLDFFYFLYLEIIFHASGHSMYEVFLRFYFFWHCS